MVAARPTLRLATTNRSASVRNAVAVTPRAKASARSGLLLRRTTRIEQGDAGGQSTAVRGPRAPSRPVPAAASKAQKARR
jgi:hypothetical protein